MTYNLLARTNTEILSGVVPELLISRIQKDPHTYCMLAYDDTKYYGVCVFYRIRQAVFISYFYVDPNVSRQGIGGELLEKVIAVNSEKGTEVFQMSVPDDLTGELIPFLEKHGFTNEGFQQIWEFSLKTVTKSEYFKKLAKKFKEDDRSTPASIFMEEGVLRLEQVETAEILRYSQELSDQGDYYHFVNPRVDRHCSSVYLKNGKIIACFLIGYEDETVTIEYANTEKAGVMVTAKLINESFQNVRDSYGENCTVSVFVTNDNAEGMLKKLVPDYISQEKVWSMTYEF